MNITRLLSVLLIGSAFLVAIAPQADAQREARNTVTAPPPVEETVGSPR